MNTLMMGWTTTENSADAETIARAVISNQLAACAQIDGPISSLYKWNGILEKSSEFRLLIKFPSKNADALEEWILKNHPYAVPEWVVLRADRVSPPYLEWTCQSC